MSKNMIVAVQTVGLAVALAAMPGGGNFEKR